jgi:tRNA pseudouridine65 synthase
MVARPGGDWGVMRGASRGQSGLTGERPPRQDGAPAVSAASSGSSVLRILFADRDLAALDKPSGLAVHHAGVRGEPTAAALAAALLGPVFPVHRLDRGTSGVWLVARNVEAARLLSAAFAARSVDKKYLALVRGEAPPSGDIDAPVPKDEGGARVPARTTFERQCVFSFPAALAELAAGMGVRAVYSLVEAFPQTGRFHQVRRHLKHIGHPIVGDVNYGRGEINRFFRAHLGLDRLFLHCACLSLAHPATGERLEVTAPLPRELQDVAARLAGGASQKT